MRSPRSSPPTGSRCCWRLPGASSATLRGLDVIARAGNPLGGVTSLSAIPGTDDVIVSGGAGGAGRLARVELETGHMEAMTELHGRETLVNLVVSADGSVVVAQEVDSGFYEAFDARSLDSITGPLPGTGPVAVDTPAPFVSADGSDARDSGVRAQARGPGHRSPVMGGERLRHRGEEPHRAASGTSSSVLRSPTDRRVPADSRASSDARGSARRRDHRHRHLRV